MTPATDIRALPLVLGVEEVCGLLRRSERTLARWRRSGRFAVPELPQLPGRWWRDDVLAWLRPQEPATVTRFFARARRAASR